MSDWKDLKRQGPTSAIDTDRQVGKLILREADSQDMGVSENSVPLNPMVNDHYPY